MKTQTNYRGMLCVLAVLFVALALNYVLQPPCVFAQSAMASVSGQVTDTSGGVIPGAEVQIKNVDTNIQQVTKTNDVGFYSFVSLKPGNYLMTVTKAMFRAVSVTGMNLAVQENLSRNFTLQVGSATESITVTSEALSINTTDGSVSTVVNQQFVANMPLNGRSFQSLIYTTPGVVISAVGSDPGTFSTNGQRTNANYFTVDGVSANFGSSPQMVPGQSVTGSAMAATAAGGTNGLVSVDEMQEFRIQTSTYAPEFGRMPGGQVSIVTKSGTNQWHGTAYDYVRNDVFDARNFFNTTLQPKPPLRQNDFGGTFSGPILKDRTFFFFSYEGNRLRQPVVNTGYYLPASERANVSGAWAWVIAATAVGPPVAADGSNLQDRYCGANGAGGGYSTDPKSPNYNPCTTKLTLGQSNPSSLDSYALRMDHNLTGKINLFGRYNHAPSYTGQAVFNRDPNHTSMNNDTMTLGATYAIAPTMVNDLRLNWSRQDGSNLAFIYNTFGATVPSDSQLYPPNGSVSAVCYYFNTPNKEISYLGFCAGKWQLAVQRQWNVVDTLSKSIGAHQLKFGMDWRRVNPTNLAGHYYLLSGVWGQTNTVSSASVQMNYPITAHMDNWSFFAQDTWKLSPKLTLTYGLRWEINTSPVSDTEGKPFYSVDGIFNSNPVALITAPLWNTRYTNVAPRLGAAYSMTPRTVIRAGFGMFYDLGYSGAVGNAMTGFPYRSSTTLLNIPFDISNPALAAIPFTTTIAPSSTLPVFDPHLKLPLTYQWNVAFERLLGSSQSITATYVAARGTDLVATNVVVPPGSPWASSPYAGLYGAQAATNRASSHYNALQLQFMRRMAHGLQAMANYTFARSTDNASNDSVVFLSPAPSLSAIAIPPLTPSNFDVRHNISAVISYEIPRTSRGGFAGRNLVNGWALDGVWKVQSGAPINVLGYVYAPNGYFTYEAQDVAGVPQWVPDPNEPAGKKLNVNAFAKPADFSSTLGNRNNIQNPYWLNQVDTALRRRFSITERVKLDFRVEYFNLFNHPMFSTVYTSWSAGSQSFGKVSAQTLNQVLGRGGAVGGQSPLYGPGGNRSGQFTVKLSF